MEIKNILQQRQQILQRQQYSPMGQPPNSPLSRSPLIGIQPPSSPLSVRSPLISSQTTPSPSPQPDSGNGGGGNPHLNPTPLPIEFYKYTYSKLGLRGGSPMWGVSKTNKRMGAADSLQGSSGQQIDQGNLFSVDFNNMYLNLNFDSSFFLQVYHRNLKKNRI